jgi:tetratricopeptide (TPR) repeat protein
VLAEVLNYAGEPERALTSAATAIQLDRHKSAHYPYIIGQAYYVQAHYHGRQGQSDSAQEALQKAEDALTDSLRRNHNFWPALPYLVAIEVESGRHGKRRARIRDIRRAIAKPAGERQTSAPYKDPAITERLRAAWRMAGEPT